MVGLDLLGTARGGGERLRHSRHEPAGRVGVLDELARDRGELLLVDVVGGCLSLLPGLLVLGAGTGSSMTPSPEAVTSSLPREKQGVASALNDVTREFGTALGVAMPGALPSAGYRTAIDDRLDGMPQDAADPAREGITNAVEVAPGTGSHAPDLLHAAQQSFVDGWQQAMGAGTRRHGSALRLRRPARPEEHLLRSVLARSRDQRHRPRPMPG